MQCRSAGPSRSGSWLAELPERERGAALEALLGREASRPFDLATDLMLRVLLVRLAERENVVLFSMHHIASDGWSAGVLRRELAAAYAAFTGGGTPQLVSLPIQYADFAVWQRESRPAGELLVQLAYWRRQLAGAIPTEVPTDRPRPSAPTIASPLIGSCGRLAGRSTSWPAERSTPFMTPARPALLHRYTGQDDV